MIASTFRRLKVVWPRSLSSTHRAEERGPNVLDPRAEVSDLRAEVSVPESEVPDLRLEVFSLGPAVFALYSVLILFPHKERNKNTVS